MRTDLTLGTFLTTVHDFLCRYVALPSAHEPVAIALWVAHTWMVERFDVSPILAVTSAEKRSGKTSVLDVLELLVPNPYRMVTPSEAGFYTIAAQREPRATILFDEVDTVFVNRASERTEGIRAVLNSGNRQGTPVIRAQMNGKRREVEMLDVYGAKVLAGIGELPDTVADRSIQIRMRRKASDEPVVRFRRRTAGDEADAITHPDWPSVPLVPDVPPIGAPMNDRAEDSWEPLMSIALAAGDPWPIRARAAALALTGDVDEAVSLGIRLLTDIRDLFSVRGEPQYVGTPELLGALHDLDDAPWGSLKGDPLTARYLARLLKPYGIKPDQWRDGDARIRGYLRVHLEDAWKRYCPPVGASASETSGTSGTFDPEYATDDDGELAA